MFVRSLRLALSRRQADARREKGDVAVVGARERRVHHAPRARTLLFLLTRTMRLWVQIIVWNTGYIYGLPDTGK